MGGANGPHRPPIAAGIGYLGGAGVHENDMPGMRLRMACISVLPTDDRKAQRNKAKHLAQDIG